MDQMSELDHAILECAKIAIENDWSLTFDYPIGGDPKTPQVAFRYKRYDDPFQTAVIFVPCGGEGSISDRCARLVELYLSLKTADSTK